MLSFCHNAHVWQTDGQTDGQMLIGRPRIRSCSAVKVIFRISDVCFEYGLKYRRNTGTDNSELRIHYVIVYPTYCDCENGDRRNGMMRWSVESRRHRLPTVANWTSTTTLWTISISAIFSDLKQKMFSFALLGALKYRRCNSAASGRGGTGWYSLDVACSRTAWQVRRATVVYHGIQHTLL